MKNKKEAIIRHDHKFYILDDGTIFDHETEKPCNVYVTDFQGVKKAFVEFPKSEECTENYDFLLDEAVAEAFKPKWDDYETKDYKLIHKDGNPENCHVSNLVWVRDRKNKPDVSSARKSAAQKGANWLARGQEAYKYIHQNEKEDYIKYLRGCGTYFRIGKQIIPASIYCPKNDKIYPYATIAADDLNLQSISKKAHDIIECCKGHISEVDGYEFQFCKVIKVHHNIPVDYFLGKQNVSPPEKRPKYLEYDKNRYKFFANDGTACFFLLTSSKDYTHPKDWLNSENMDNFIIDMQKDFIPESDIEEQNESIRETNQYIEEVSEKREQDLKKYEEAAELRSEKRNEKDFYMIELRNKINELLGVDVNNYDLRGYWVQEMILHKESGLLFGSGSDAKRKLNLASQTAILDCARGLKKSYNGQHFEYVITIYHILWKNYEELRKIKNFKKLSDIIYIDSEFSEEEIQKVTDFLQITENTK